MNRLPQPKQVALRNSNPRVSNANFSRHTFEEKSIEQSYVARSVSEPDKAQYYPQGQRPPPSCLQSSFSRLTCLVVTILMLSGLLIALLVLYTGGDPAEFFYLPDPPGLSAASRWDTNGTESLTLSVMNSCEDRWTPFFDRYLAEWDNGTPDVLNLSSEKFDYDPSCTAYDGKMNVCNANFGNTDWVGINVILIENAFIVNSVAKMNDYHLDNANDFKRFYTMCHEMGHGFGLPHTNENQHNIDRGDCMDYTSRPQNNLEPGQYNYNLLYDLYGPVNGTGKVNGTENSKFNIFGSGTLGDNLQATKDALTGTVGGSGSGGSNSSGGSGRMLVARTTPADIMQRYYLALSDLQEPLSMSMAATTSTSAAATTSAPSVTTRTAAMRKKSHGARLLAESRHHRVYSVDLGRGFKMEVRKLLATWDD
jgi:hypothetical protein